MDLKDKRAVVTGGAGGIGRAIVRRLAQAGARVAVVDLDGDAASDVVASLPDPARGIPVELDIADADRVRDAVDASVGELGGLDVLVNNAGWDSIGPFLDTDVALWDRLLSINLRGPIAVTHAALPHLIDAGGGAVVFVASDAGRVGSSGEVVYSAAKGGTIAFAKAVAREVARHQVRVNCVAPGPTDTPFLRQFGENTDRILQSMIKATPLRRLAEPDEVAAAVTFLASDDARFVTGQTLSVSGGLTMV